MLIAGTSCVDYSTLNNEKQDIDANGESGRTFRGMLSWVNRHRPKIVILENVCGAPWDRVVNKFEAIKYSAAHQRFDTRNFYIPHTRMRGYLVAVDKADSKIPNLWKQRVMQLVRPASSTLDAFLLESDDPRIHQARQALVHEGATHERKAGYDWGRCESRHIKARHDEQLGTRRPMTNWDESTCELHDSFLIVLNVLKAVILSYLILPGTIGPQIRWSVFGTLLMSQLCGPPNSTRILLIKRPCIAVSLWSHANQFYRKIWNLSQNVDRQIGSSRVGVAPCFTPTMIPYLTNRGGPLVGAEALGLQGIPVDELNFTRETQDQLADLAGNAMSSTVVGTAMVAALMLGANMFPDNTLSPDVMDVDRPSASTPTDQEKATRGVSQLQEGSIDLSAAAQRSLPRLLSQATLSARLCYCEGRDDVLDRLVRRCIDCGSTACEKCGGKPEHNFHDMDFSTSPRVRPSEYRPLLKEQLPMSVSLHALTNDVLDEAIKAAGDSIATAKWREAVLTAVSAPLSFKTDKRQETWVVIYESASARLEFHLNELNPVWLLFARPDPKEPANSSLRALLMRPVARLLCKSTLLGGIWDIAVPVSYSFPVTIEGTGQR